MHIKGPALPRVIQYWIPVFALLCAFLLPVQGICGGGKEKLIDSLKQAMVGQKDTFLIRTLIKLSQTYHTVNKDSALKYSLLLRDAAVALDSADRICDAYVILGTCYHHLHIEDSAMYYKRRALLVARESGYEKGEANAANDIGLYLKERGDFDSAIYYVLLSIDIRERNEIEKPLGVSYNNLGLIYYANKDTANAMRCYRQASIIAGKYKDLRVQSAVINNLANVFEDMGKPDSALHYFKVVKALCDSMGDRDGSARTMINMGVMYRNLGQLDVAEKLFLDAIAIKVEVDDADGEAIGCLDLSENYRLMKKYAESEKYLVRADTLAHRLQQKELQRDVYKVYADLYAETGRLAQALEYYRMYHALNEELLGEEKMRVMQEMEARFDAVKKDRENAALRETQLLNEEALAEGERRSNLMIAGIAVLVLILGLSLYAYVVKIRSTRLLEEKNQLISKQNVTLKELNKKLIDSEEELTHLNATKDDLFSIISHDLGNPVNAIVNYNTILRNQKETMTKEEMVQSLDKVNITLQPLQGFLDNLLHWSIQQRNGIMIRKEDVNVKDVIGEIISLYNASLLTKHVTVQTEVSPSLSAHTDRNILRLIMRNILGNAIKYSPNEGTVHVKCSSRNERVVIEVRNRGNKVSQEKIAAILEGKRVNSERGWLQEQGTGLGLSLVSQYLKAMDGKMEMESDEKETTLRVLI